MHVLSEYIATTDNPFSMSETHANARLEAFCDGVFAIAITLLVIDIRIPETAAIENTSGLWHALQHIAPSIYAFLLSFCVILITWVNHHNHLKMVGRSNAAFLYANGFLLLTVAFIPFPTSLLGEYLFSGHAAPAVILYEGVLTLQAVGWILISHTAVRYRLAKSEKAAMEIRRNGRFGYFAFALYALCAVAAAWFPVSVALFTTATWIFWLVFGIRIKHVEAD